MNPPKAIGYCALAALLTLYVVGLVNNEVLRHAVQTLPLWFPIVMGLRQHEMAKWTALPCFLIWLMLMSVIWLFLMGWTKVISGSFTSIEVMLTLVIGGATIAGSIIALRWHTRVTWTKALSVSAIFIVFQTVALRLSFLPAVVKDPIFFVTRS